MINKVSQLKLETKRLLIRIAQKADLKAVYAIHTDIEVNRYLPYETWLSWNDALKWYDRVEERRAKDDAEQFVIVRKSDTQIVGTCIAFDFDQSDQSCEFGYVLNRDQWGNGYMFEATSAFINGLFSADEINSIRAVVQENNASSLALLEKLGFDVIYTESAEDDQGNTNSVQYLRLNSTID